VKSGRKKAFTLVEMLTVIAIVGILAGFLLPTIKKAKDQAKKTKCAHNLKQFVDAIDLFRIEYNDYPNFLSNLYPSYVDSKEVYICPSDYCMQIPPPDRPREYDDRGADGGKPSWEPDRLEFRETDDTKYNSRYSSMRNSEEGRATGRKIDYCSYLYEFCGAACSWNSGYSWKETKKKQMKVGVDGVRVYGRVPIVRCFWHQRRKSNSDSYVSGKKDVINVAAGHKNVYFSDASEEGWWK
jgi:prepilin-type N-terminal cleavage/methylation domain-containing protein